MEAQRPGNRAETETVPAWDLSALYAGADDPRLERDLEEARSGAVGFAARWRPRLAAADLGAAELAGALVEWETIQVRGRRPGFYASLLFAADTQSSAAQRLLEHTRERWAEIDNLLVFFTLGLARLPDQVFVPLIDAAELADYRYYLTHLRRQGPHLLAEGEEQVITRKNLAGRDAFVLLFEELTGAFRFTLAVDGEERTLTGEEMLALLSRPERALRELAYAEYLHRFAEHGLVLTSIFNSLLLDHRLECELRGYPDLAAPTHLENDVSGRTVETLMRVTEEHYETARAYFRLKARVLGLERLRVTDLYAPLPASPGTIPYAAARGMIMEAFDAFSPAFGERAADFFRRGWIDAAVRPGKTGGASCSAYAPTTNPFIVASYTGTIRDATTLAHELGHGIHDLLSAGQRYVNYHPPLPLAETASVFAEMLLTRHLLARDATPARRAAILCLTLEEIIATVFRQNVLTRFELAAHEARRAEQLTTEQLCDLWWQENARFYADAVEMPAAYRWGWSYIPHFVHSRFYCYAYVFGELLALTLYQRHRVEGAAFLPHYLELLAAGGSESPAVLLRRLGWDIDDAAFWARGFAVVRGLIDDLTAVVGS